MFPGSFDGGSVPSLPVPRSSRWGPTSGTFIFSGWLLMILAGTGGGTQLGSRALRWEHLLSITHHLHRFLPSGSRRLLLRCSRSRLVETRSSGHLWLSLWLVAPANACSCQQVLHSGSQQYAHGLECRHPRWQVTWGSYPSCRGASHGLSGRDHGRIAHCGWRPQGRCRARSLARDCRALTPLADSKTASAVSHPGESLQSVQHTNYVRLWATHCHLRRQSHVRGNVLHMRGPLGQVIAQQVNCSGPG